MNTRILRATAFAAFLCTLAALALWVYPHEGRAQTSTGTAMDQNGMFTVSRRAYNNAPNRSIVATAAAANGFQISTSRDADARYSVAITTVATVGGNSTGTVALEICPTNSATATDWVMVSQFSQGQSFGVVVGISCTQTITSSLRAAVPAGYYVRLRSVNVAGTPTFAMVSGQEVLQ